jgi:hypothetical protein
MAGLVVGLWLLVGVVVMVVMVVTRACSMAGVVMGVPVVLVEPASSMSMTAMVGLVAMAVTAVGVVAVGLVWPRNPVVAGLSSLV